MSLYEAYLDDVAEREKLGLNPKPIDSGALIDEIILFLIFTITLLYLFQVFLKNIF